MTTQRSLRPTAGAERRFYGGMAVGILAVYAPLRILLSRTDEWVVASHWLVNLVQY